jgi:leucyl-tRNA synthetase
MLEMFAYTSGDIHMGHFRNYILGDAVARYRMMQGYDVLHPFGWDAFGLPAEEAAIKRGEDPETWTLGNIENSRRTLAQMGLTYDWDREVVTCLPDYYRWTQWVFLTLHERGLAYRADALVNWCPRCQTVLANEQVSTGSCWRCNSQVTKRELRQWFLRITDYAQRLLEGLDHLDKWPANLKTMQRNWIGRSEGAEISFDLPGEPEPLRVFTTRADTLFGVTYLAMAPESPLARKLSGGPRGGPLRQFIQRQVNRTEIERSASQGAKEGIFTGEWAVHPLSGEKVPLWIADYVLPGYGTGIVMGVPGHDQRDFEFARSHHLPVKVVVQPPGVILDGERMERAYVEQGVMANSPGFNGLESEEGRARVTAALEDRQRGGARVLYRLRDWLISRQRYWGAPIPIIHCPSCGAVPVPYEELPVLLPKGKIDYIPKGRSPLADSPDFIRTRCPRCGEDAERDPDTMDTFVCSSWYHLRYTDPRNDRQPFSPEAARVWLPIDFYVGGIEHACGHLLYFRFITKVLFDAGLLPVDEPALRLFNHGMVLDARGEVMSKSKGNVISPAATMRERGTDVSRLAMYFAAPPERDMLWSDEGLTGASRFVNRVWQLVCEIARVESPVAMGAGNTDDGVCQDLVRHLHRTVKTVTHDLEEMHLNTAISAMMEFLNRLESSAAAPAALRRVCGETLVRLLAPFAPHLCEELWGRLGKGVSVFRSPWPTYDEQALREDYLTLVVQVNGKVRSQVTVPSAATDEAIRSAALDDQRVQQWVKDKQIRKIFVVPGRLVNIVAT